MNVSRTARGLLAALPALALAACADQAKEPLAPAAPSLAAAPNGAAADAAHGRDETGPKPDAIFNRYIVRFREGVGEPEQASRELVGRHGGVRTHVYSRVFKGFAAVNLPPQALEALRRNPNVASVSEERLLRADATQFSPGWALDRMDQTGATLNAQFNFFFSGAGTHVYILDSGIRRDHTEFTGRLGRGENEVSFDASDPYQDDGGHGTAVASAAAGNTAGIARGATLHSVKVNDGDGSAWEGDIVDGVEWVIANVERPAVINVSFEGSDNLRDAVSAAIAARIVVTKSGGNASQDACNDPVTGAWWALVVGATGNGDTRASFSNFGPCIDVWAPGSAVRVAGHTFSTAFTTKNGTSFAAPYVAGIAALILQQRPNAQVSEVYDLVRNSATQGALLDIGGAPNLLAHSQHQYARIAGVNGVNTYDGAAEGWNAETLGGSGSWTYLWELSINGGPFQVVSQTSNYTRYFGAREQYRMDLRLTATSAGRTLVHNRRVDVVSVAPGPEEPECTNPKLCDL